MTSHTTRTNGGLVRRVLRHRFTVRSLALAVASLGVATTVVLIDQSPAARPSHAPVSAAAVAVAQDRSAQVQPVASPYVDSKTPLTTFPEVIRSPWLYAFADRIVYAHSDADINECVHREGYYSQAEGMQLEQVDSILHPDGSVDITTRRHSIITHQRFASMTIGDIPFRGVPADRTHEPAGEMQYVLGRQLPHNERALFEAMYAGYAKAPFNDGLPPINVLRDINSTAIGQVPRLDTRIAMLRLLARMPGVRVNSEAQDPLLRLTVAITLPAEHDEDTLYVDPSSGQVMAYTQITLSGYTPRGTKVPHLRQAILHRQGCQ